jgi:tetratricopeptide (TPR) repeat protein
MVLACWLAALGPSTAVSSDAFYQLVVAKLLAEEGLYQKAIEGFDRAIEIAPEDPYLRIEFGKMLMRLGRYGEAAEQATAARSLAPGNIDALQFFAEAHLNWAQRDQVGLEPARQALEELRLRSPHDLDSMVSLGQIYLSESQPEKAAEVFRELLSQRPGSRMVYSLLTEALMQSQQLAEAEALLQEAVEFDQTFSRARLQLAELQSERGDHRAAAATLRGAPEEQQDDSELQRLLAFELHHLGDYEDALKVLDLLLEQHPDYFAGRYLKAVSLAALGRDNEAVYLLRDLLQERPENLELAALLAQLAERQGEQQEAIAVLQSVEERLRDGGKTDQAMRARGQQAMVFARSGSWQAVVDLLEPMLSENLSAGDLDWSLLLAEALTRLERQEEALEVLSRFEPGGTAERRVWAKQAEILFAIDRADEAEQKLAQLRSSGDLDDLALVAEVYQTHERYEEAIPVLLQAREIEPRSTSFLFWLGAAYERLGRKQEAEEALGEVLEIDPDFAPALNYLGYMWAEQGENLERALELVQHAVNLDPDNGAYIDSLGWAHFQLGQYDEARGYLEKAVDLVGEDAVVLEHLGDLYLALSRREDARALYRRALAVGGENSGQLQEKLDRLDRGR